MAALYLAGVGLGRVCPRTVLVAVDVVTAALLTVYGCCLGYRAVHER